MNHADNPDRRRFCLNALGAAAGAALAPRMAGAQAADPFPGKPIRVVVPFPAGGFGDALMRQVGSLAAERLGQPMLIDNRPGVSGSLGAEIVVNAPPDGYTLLATLTASLASSSVLYSKLRYDPAKDLVCVSELAMLYGAWVVSSSLPVHNVRELIDYSRANPDKVSLGSLGYGSSGHILQTLLNNKYGARVLHVPYKGEAPIVQDLLGGQINMAVLAGTHVQQHKPSGELRCIGIQGVRRCPVAPDVPTVAEQGFHEETWSRESPFAVFAPRGTSAAVLQRLSDAFKAAVGAPGVVKFLQDGGIFGNGNSPAQAQASFEQFYRVIRQSTAATGVVLD